jgi:CubicO group peptidase (beta-lactamase class C family)
VSPEWVKASTTPHAAISDHREYGYLRWLQSFTSATHGKRHPAFFMTGNGGNKALASPSLDMTVVTATSYNTKGMHDLTDKILTGSNPSRADSRHYFRLADYPSRTGLIVGVPQLQSVSMESRRYSLPGGSTSSAPLLLYISVA